MSEEQNLFEAVAPAPPRVRRQSKKPAAKQEAVSVNENSEIRASGDGGSGGRETGGSAALVSDHSARGEDAGIGRDAGSGGDVGSSREASGGAEAGGSGDAGGGGSEGQAGSSKSRRRRRKRKNRAAQAANAGANGGVVSNVEAGAGSDMPVTLPGEQRQVIQNAAGAHHQGNHGGANSNGGQGSQNGQGFQNAHGSQNGQGFQNGQGQGGGGSRRNKKKKFRRAGEGGGEGGSNGQSFQRPPRPEPGNSLQGSTSGMGARRNRKQQGGGGSRGPRQFVGPMDHSYREVNGNFADGPASTIQVSNGRHRSNGHHRHFNEDRLPPELMHNNRPIAIPEGAPTHIYFFIEDLFFTAKIQEAAKQQGVKVAFMKPDKDVVAHLSELHDHEHPSLIVFDLNNAAAKPLTLIPKLKAKLKKGTSIIGFLSHLQGDLKQKAVEAGCHTVMPRSAFSQNLPNLLRRYGVEDEHEPNFNQ